MLERNTMQYGCDSFNFTRKALLKSRAPLDFTYETSISNFQIAGTEPENCARRVIFFIDGYYYKYVNGILDRYDDRLDVDDILKHGNTVAELLALSADSLASLRGKKVYPWIALEAPADSPVMPLIKISATVNSFNDIYTKTECSPVYKLKCAGESCKIISVNPSTITNGYGTVDVKCKFNHPVTGWSDWIAPADAAYKTATAVQFQVRYVLTTLDGSDFAGVNYVAVTYTTDEDKLSGDTTEIVTQMQEYPYGSLGTCYALVKHSELIDCSVRAFVTFSNAVRKRMDISLGDANGNEQTVALGDSNFAADTIHLEIGNKTCTDFHYDTADGTITFTGNAGDAVKISYEYGGGGDGEWYEMQQDMAYNDEGVHFTRFTYRLPFASQRPASAVKFAFIKGSGRVTNQRLGSGNGREQGFYIPHRAKLESVNCTGSWKYDENAQILYVIAPIDEPVVVSYEWSGQMPEIFGYVAGWQPALR